MLKGEKYFSILISFFVTCIAILTYWDSLHTIISWQSSKDDTKLNFLSHWHDPIAGITKKLLLTYFPRDHSVELYDTQAKRPFLKRHPFEDLNENDFYVGNSVVILTRQLKLVDYADAATREYIEKKRQRTFAMIKPDAVSKTGEIINLILSRGFDISQLKMMRLTAGQAQEFYGEHKGRPFYNHLVDYITSGNVIAMELISSNALTKWREVLGPTDSEEARNQVPESLRAIYGTDKQENAAHGSDSLLSAQRELNFFFHNHDNSNKRSGQACQGTTCCVIKPHSVKSGHLGAILIEIIKGGYEISSMQMFRLHKQQAEEFLEVYKEVVNEYPKMVEQFISGPLVALEISQNDKENLPQKFREFVGPSDPDIAKELRPSSLRSLFGEDKIRNAIHCTDLPEDAPLEVDYFFTILQ